MFTMEVETDSDGELILTFPDELLEALDWQPGDWLTWVENKNGTWTIVKEISHD